MCEHCDVGDYYCQDCGRMLCDDVQSGGDDVIAAPYVTASGDLFCCFCGPAYDEDDEEDEFYGDDFNYDDDDDPEYNDALREDEEFDAVDEDEGGW